MPTLNDLHSFLACAPRITRGLIASNPRAERPDLPLELYEFESCPYCRKVREVMSELDLVYIAHPCARGSKNREKVIALGGKALFPYLVDPNTGAAMYESEDIITYLAETYGGGRSTAGKLLSPLNTFGAMAASAIRPLGGKTVALGARPEQPLDLWQFEASPFSRKVREALNELDLDARIFNVAKRSPRRPELTVLGGRMMVPYLVDPNTGTAMYESDDIVEYLHATYGAPAA